MLEVVDLNAKVSGAHYKAARSRLDLELGQLQRDMHRSGGPVLVVFEGWDAAGKGSVLNRLLQPLDPRGYKVLNVKAPTEEERMRPPMRRYWLMLPPRGELALFNHSWYRQVLDDLVDGSCRKSDVTQAYERIRSFERQLHDDGAVVVKLFFHISKKEQAKRFKVWRRDPAFAWKIGKLERNRHKKYDQYLRVTESMLEETSTDFAPWTIVPATDELYALILVAETLVSAFKSAIERSQQSLPKPIPRPPNPTGPLDRLDLSQSISAKVYEKKLGKRQQELRRLQHVCYFRRRAVAIVYEGWDAAGKGGNIRRLVRELDPRGYEVAPIAAPQGEERTHHYLWRFWRAVPKAGHFTLFDRSWYGRVLVERIEGFATANEWERAYREINEFESQLAQSGVLVLKFWLHISREEQLKRFNERKVAPHKQWKITDEDWRNREKWTEYWHAVTDMIERTSTPHAPWVVVEGNDKRFARIKVLDTVVKRLKKFLAD